MKNFTVHTIAMTTLIFYCMSSLAGNPCKPNPPSCHAKDYCGTTTGVCVIEINPTGDLFPLNDRNHRSANPSQFVCVKTNTLLVWDVVPRTPGNFDFKVAFSVSPFEAGGTSFTGATAWNAANPWTRPDYVVPNSPNTCFDYIVTVPGGCTGSPPSCHTNDPAVIIDNTNMHNTGHRPD